MQKKKSKAKKVEQVRNIPSGWDTTDEDEIRRRRLRAESEQMQVTNLDPGIDYFSNYNVHSGSKNQYVVEVRSLLERVNSCSCTDYDTNGLGTCKHIEKVLLMLKKKGKGKFQKAAKAGSTQVEIYVNPENNKINISWANEQKADSEIYKLLNDFFSADGSLIADASIAIPVIERLINSSAESIQKNIRLSHRIKLALDNSSDFLQKQTARDFFLQDVAAGKSSLDIMKLPLYDYQKHGMLHLAFSQRAMLADEMGLGKTVQAIAACELLRRIRGIRKVLVVSPTSLKAEWEEQIVKFADLPSIIVYGNKHIRLHQYQNDTFFYLVNYEQVLRDHDHIQRIIAPDVIILDEAQRIKNWKTKTAMAIKKLHSHYAFVLTGTPIENRIDDIYSIMQFLDPSFFGSLFRFNREFYRLDEKGKPIGYKNLDVLHEKLKPVLLRRLKCDVEGQLPERIVNNYFVPMSEEQNERYADYEHIVARLAATAKKRPLLKEEFERLQQALASMRMLCDTPYILDEECRICPKLHELENLLGELFQDKDTKIIIFSEWIRMLMLVRELLENMGIKFAWHTGDVDQKKRRDEINYFKNDEQCKVFLSTDSGSVGLNLQVANVVINLDLPWNPARLEQRIARAWRKHQRKTVQIINLISENTIEHRMIGLLNLKRSLADSVLDSGDSTEVEIPSGRASLMNNLNEIIGHTILPANKIELFDKAKAKDTDPISQLKDEIISRFKSRLYRLETYQGANGRQTILAIIDGEPKHPHQQIQNIINRLGQQGILELEVLDRVTYETIQKLSGAGILSFNQENNINLYQSHIKMVSICAEEKKRLKAAQKYLEQTERKKNLTAILIENEFYDEAIIPMHEVFELSLKSFATFLDCTVDDNENISLEILHNRLTGKSGLPDYTVNLAKILRNTKSNVPFNEETAKSLLSSVQNITQITQKILDKSALEHDL